MNVKEVNDLISLMACVCMSEMDGSMCPKYVDQANEFLRNYPEDIRHHFIECWTAASRCVTLNGL